MPNFCINCNLKIRISHLNIGIWEMADDLKQQFQLLQEQKKQKLRRKNEARAENAKRSKAIGEEQSGGSAKKMENDKSLPSALDEIDDNLNLEVQLNNWK